MTTPDEMMEIGRAYVACCSEGRLPDLHQKYYAQDAVSAEAAPMPDGSTEAQGLEAIQAKNNWWFGAHEVHAMNVEGPFVHGDRFNVIFDIDVTHKESGERTQMREIGSLVVKDGKIVREEFSYALA